MEHTMAETTLQSLQELHELIVWIGPSTSYVSWTISNKPGRKYKRAKGRILVRICNFKPSNIRIRGSAQVCSYCVSI